LNLLVETVKTGSFQENSFIGWYPNSTEAFLIDPGDDAHLIAEFIERNSLIPKAIINTHAHLDHIGAVQSLKEKFNIPFYLHRNEKIILDSYEVSCQIFGIQPKQKPNVDMWFDNECELIIDKFKINTINTPGHTPGGTCLQVENHIFVGDTIFRGSVGRTDLLGGNSSHLESSLIHLINSIDHNSTIHSGHGPDTTLKYELSKNPFLIPLKDRLN
jgi:hydroxyacylglutathione hydrolase|tara:strand:+ start:923 stop:1570 length:648 start_codon:yes stop_codon:yes gene_type:complete